MSLWKWIDQCFVKDCRSHWWPSNDFGIRIMKTPVDSTITNDKYRT